MKNPARRRRAGFTLVELIVVMSLIALLSGVVAPAAGSLLRSKSRRVTLQEMELLAEAVVAYYTDTSTFPSEPLDLLSDTVTGWSGPYLAGTVDDTWSGLSGYTVDAFGNPYDFSTSGLELTIQSDGADSTGGTADDLTLIVNATPILRSKTMDELAILNGAVTRYNSVYLGVDPLPADWNLALSKLESYGYLPPGAGYDRDAFGDTFTGNPPGAAPLTEVRSPNVSN